MDIITLINTFVSGLLNAEEEFLEHLDSFTMFEETVSRLSNQMAADFIGLALTNADRMICDSGIRKSGYTVQRRRQRTLISIVGDITFTHTLYKDQRGKSRCLLDELMHLPGRERFTAAAEAKLFERSGSAFLSACRGIYQDKWADGHKDNGNEQSPLHRKRDPGDGRTAKGKESL